MSGSVSGRVGAFCRGVILGCCLVACASPLLAQDVPEVDGGWPRYHGTASGGEVTLFAPQVAGWDGQKHMVGFCAVSYAPKGAAKSELGTVKFEAETEVSVEERLVRFVTLRLTESNFPTRSRDQIREVTAGVVACYPDTSRALALDRVLAAIDRSQIMPRNLEGLKADPPPIYFSKRPAVLVVLDGDAIWSPIQDNELKFAVNTNWDLFQQTPTNTLFLRVDGAWLTAPQLGGPWEPARDLPASFKALPDPDWKEVKANLPGEKLSLEKAPVVFTTVQPADLILLAGEPKYVPVTGTRLQWVSNTESDLFRLGENGPVYCLLAGRWFSAPDFTGPWEFASPNLPEDFRRIPPEHERAHVLASVPGTDEAAQAILLAQIPQTARVDRAQVKAPEVAYTGEPRFTPIKGTTCEQAANTDKDIIKVGDLYYMCFQGVWFMSTTPSGPWEVTGEVPKTIYSIPPESECHHVTYVMVDHYDPADAYVTFAYTAGYTGVYIAWGVPVYGTGWYYPPYVYYGYPYPVYYPRWVTYGCGVRYNPWTGGYVGALRYYGPYGGVRYAAAYNPHTGTYARGGVAYGPYGARGAAQAWNPRTNTYGATRQGGNAYGSWGSTYVQRGDGWAQTSRFTNKQTGSTTRVTETGQGAVVSRRGSGGSGFIAKGEDNIYAGHDGNVYKRGESGNWQKYEDGSWSDAGAKAGVDATKSGSPPVRQLDRDRTARDRGAERTGEFSRQRATRTVAAPSPPSGRAGGGRRR